MQARGATTAQSQARAALAPALPYAMGWPRAGAYLMDTVLLIWVAVVLFFVLWASGVSPGVAAIAAWAGTEGGIRGLVYAPLLMRRPGAHNGQTLGKQLTGIRVVREDGRPMTYGAAVMREWVARTLLIEILGAAVSAGIVVLLDYVQPLWDERRRALHDMLAATLVLAAQSRRQL